MPLQKMKDWAELSGQAAVKASQLVLPWDLVCSETLGSWVTAAAEAKGSLPCYSFMTLLPLVNSMVGSTTSIVLEEDWEVSPAIYSVCVGASGTNKSGVHKSFLTQPVRHVEQTFGQQVDNAGMETSNCKLLLDQYTTSGLHAHLAANQGEHLSF